MEKIGNQKNYYQIDIMKYLFACLIPLLHIPFTNGLFIDIARQYFSRLGVPFFFITTGYLLARKMDRISPLEVFKGQFSRAGKLLLVWILIYIVPIYLVDDAFKMAPIRTLLFKTPAYLWYLTAVLFGLIPFCLIKQRKVKWFIAICLYVLGTLFSDSYSWLAGSIPLYNRVFLTYRNGLFFAFPVMCFGEYAYIYKRRIKKPALLLAVSYIIFVAEVFFIRNKAGIGADSSMTMFLPFVVLFLLLLLVGEKQSKRFYYPWMRTSSTAIYLMQFAFVFLGKVMQKFIGIGDVIWGLIYIAIIVIPTIIIIRFGDKSITKILF